MPKPTDARKWKVEAARRDEEDLASAVRSLREAALSLRRSVGIVSETDFYARLDEAFDILEGAPEDDPSRGHAELSELQRAALMYQFVDFDLERFRSSGMGSPVAQLLSLARAGDWLVWWAIDGSAAALDKVQRQREQPKLAAAAPRPGRRSSLLVRVVEMMRPYRRDRTTFKDFLAGWLQAESREDLSIEELVAGESYAVQDDRDISPAATPYTFGSLRTIYSTSIKEQRR